MKTERDILVEEFTELRNARMVRGTCKRTRNIHFDWLNNTDTLARGKTDDELKRDIKRMTAK